MKWTEMTPREKTERIVQDIMGWTYFPTWDIMHTARWALENANPMAYPYAFWSDKQEGVFVFYHEYEDAYLFNPLGNMGDAWQVLSKFYEEHSADGELHAPLAYHLGVTYYEPVYHSDVFQISSLEQLVNLTPERICKAILQTRGVNVE